MSPTRPRHIAGRAARALAALLADPIRLTFQVERDELVAIRLEDAGG